MVDALIILILWNYDDLICTNCIAQCTMHSYQFHLWQLSEFSISIGWACVRRSHSNHFCTIFISSFIISFFPFVRAAHEHHILHISRTHLGLSFRIARTTKYFSFFFSFRGCLFHSLYSFTTLIQMWWLSNAFWILFELFVGFLVLCFYFRVSWVRVWTLCGRGEKKLGYLITGIHIR